MENLGKFTLSILMIVVSIFVTLLLTKVILSVSNLYELSFITQFTFVQIYGVLTVLGLIRYNYKKEDAANDFGEMISEMVVALIMRVMIILLGWGLAFIVYRILT